MLSTDACKGRSIRDPFVWGPHILTIITGFWKFPHDETA